ncbi:MAG TPA: hypothetical protein VNA20_00695 [Frankiaceae bacterium]|nr:hypothetical protein [Frankiaceae bacterium]
MPRRRYPLVATLAVLAAVSAATAPPAVAVAVRDCVSTGTWVFDQPLTTSPVLLGTVTLDARTTCFRYTVGGGVSTESYTSGTWLSYTGNCAAMDLYWGGVYAGGMAHESVITTHHVGGVVSSSVHFVHDHPVCAGATTLYSEFGWVHVTP